MMVHEFNLLRRILKERSGIELGPDKMDLVEAKLRPLIKEYEFPSFAHLMLALIKPDADGLRARVAQTLAVLESYFFRDKAPFKFFDDVMLPRLLERRRASRRIRIWCAASATGQEPYSLAMLLAEAGPKIEGWSIDVVATDFSEEGLRKARTGLYSQFEVQRGLPVSLLVRYFQKAGNGWQVKPGIRKRIAFREHNLLNDCRDLGVFDIIFCRNVLIYFDEHLKRAVLGRLTRQLASDGYLVLGAAETTSGLVPDLIPVPEGHHGIFCLSPAAVAARTHSMAKPRHEPVAGDVRQGDAHTVSVPKRDDAVRAVELDRATAELLEARSRARGMSVAELLAEYAASGIPNPENWQGPRLKS
jgi:chemotaxis protein methyltransferase CheR